MADPINLETVVDDLSKPENAGELNKALNDAFKEATNPLADNTAAPIPGDNKVTPSEDPSQQKAGDDNKAPTNRIDDILADRNAAKAEAADKQTEVQTLTKQVETLAKLVEDLKSGKPGEKAVADSTDDGADDKPMTNKDIDAYFEKKLQEQSATKTQSEAAEKSITEGIQALDTNKETPHASKFQAEIRKVMETFPNMKADVAYATLVGKGIIPADNIVSSNANRTGTGNRSKTNLLDTKKPTDMSQDEALSFLKGAEKAGDLNGLI